MIAICLLFLLLLLLLLLSFYFETQVVFSTLHFERQLFFCTLLINLTPYTCEYICTYVTPPADTTWQSVERQRVDSDCCCYSCCCCCRRWRCDAASWCFHFMRALLRLYLCCDSTLILFFANFALCAFLLFVAFLPLYLFACSMQFVSFSISTHTHIHTLTHKQQQNSRAFKHNYTHHNFSCCYYYCCCCRCYFLVWVFLKSARCHWFFTVFLPSSLQGWAPICIRPCTSMYVCSWMCAFRKRQKLKLQIFHLNSVFCLEF